MWNSDTCFFKSNKYCTDQQGQKVSIIVDHNNNIDIYAIIFGIHKHCHEYVSCDGNKVNLPETENDCTKAFMKHMGINNVNITYNNVQDIVNVYLGSEI